MLIYVLFSVYSNSKEKALSCQFNKLVKHSHYLKTLTTYYTLPITIILILNKNILKLKLNKYIIGKLKLLPIIISNSRTDGKDPCPIFRLFFLKRKTTGNFKLRSFGGPSQTRHQTRPGREVTRRKEA